MTTVVTRHFPSDLLELQLALQQTRAALDSLCRELPWSAEPLDGWIAKSATATGPEIDRPDSPGYTAEQHRQWRELLGRLREVSITVSTHPYWQSLAGPARVAARMELKHVLDDAGDVDDGQDTGGRDGASAAAA